MEKIFISVGVVLSLGGVWLMIRASVYKDPKTRKKWANRHDPISWMLKWGWICLIVGIIAQIAGIWSTELFQLISSTFAGPPVIKNLPELKATSWDAVNLIIQSQYNVAMWGVMGALVIAGIVAAVSFTYHLLFAQKIVQEAKKELEEKINEAKNFFEVELRKIELSTLISDNLISGAVLMEMRKSEKALVFFSRSAIAMYTKKKDDSNLRSILDTLIFLLNGCDSLEHATITEVRENIDKLGPFYDKEKEQIFDILKAKEGTRK